MFQSLFDEPALIVYADPGIEGPMVRRLQESDAALFCEHTEAAGGMTHALIDCTGYRWDLHPG
jgi:hypothetical protein